MASMAAARGDDSELLSRALGVSEMITTSNSSATVLPFIQARDPADIVVSIHGETVTKTVTAEAEPSAVEFNFSVGEDDDHDDLDDDVLGDDGHDLDDDFSSLPFLG